MQEIFDSSIIQNYHRHRYPYFLLDEIDEIDPGKSAHGYKYFSENEWLFHCNVKDNQPYPFTMVVEVLTEAFLMPILTLDGNQGEMTNFVSADEVHLYSDIYPGMVMDIIVEIESWRRGVASGYVSGTIEGNLVCEAKMKFVLPKIMGQFKPNI